MSKVAKELNVYFENEEEFLTFSFNEDKFEICLFLEHRETSEEFDIETAIKLRDFLNYALKDYDTATTKTE